MPPANGASPVGPALRAIAGGMIVAVALLTVLLAVASLASVLAEGDVSLLGLVVAEHAGGRNVFEVVARPGPAAPVLLVGIPVVAAVWTVRGRRRSGRADH
jgi:hypothetical protein